MAALVSAGEITSSPLVPIKYGVTFRRFVRDNAFLVGAVSLPLLVVAFFLLSTLIPRWRVPPPAYDLLIRADGSYDRSAPSLTVDYVVRDGTVEATFKRAPAETYTRPGELFLVDHETMETRLVPVEIPRDLGPDDPPRTIVVQALEGRQVLAQPKAPDGYEFQTRYRGGPGIVGELFGMNRYDPGATLVNNGRVITITLPVEYRYYTVQHVGWVTPAAQTGRQ